MNNNLLMSVLEKNTITRDEINSILDNTLTSTDKSHVLSFQKFYRKFFQFFEEQDFYKLIECMDFYFNDENLDDEVKGELCNNKTFCSLYLNNKYQALDSCFKFKSLKVIDPLKNFLNFNHLVSIYFEQGLFEEALKEGDVFFSKYSLNDLTDFYQFIYLLNFSLIYAKINNYDKYIEFYNKALQAAKKCENEEDTMTLKLSRISSESILYFNNKEKINYNDNIIEYKELLKDFFSRNVLSFDTIDTHVDIIDSLITLERYEEAQEICLLILDNVKTLSFKKEIYRCLKKIYDIKPNEDLFAYMIEYLKVCEELEVSEKEFYKTYILNAIRLYQKSNDYNILLDSYEHDTLTKCYSRGAFIKVSKNETSFKGHLIYIDLNNLKTINDTYGHNHGDDYLIKFGEVVQEVFKGQGSIYRIGGDEFVILTKIENKEEVIKQLTILNDNLSKLSDANPDLKYCFSSGIAKFKNDIKFDDVLNQADKAMYICKKNKEKFYSFYD